MNGHFSSSPFYVPDTRGSTGNDWLFPLSVQHPHNWHIFVRRLGEYLSFFKDEDIYGTALQRINK